MKIVRGRDDPWIALDRSRALHERMPGTDFARLPGVGRLPQLEAPDAVLREVIGFLGG